MFLVRIARNPWGYFFLSILLLLTAATCLDAADHSDAEIDRLIGSPENSAVISAFMKYELRLVNEYATKPLLKRYPSLEFFVKQAERGPMQNLLFLEGQVKKLRDVQKHIDSTLYAIAFSKDERKKLMSIVPEADEIVLYGIPRFKKDLYRLLTAILKVAAMKGKPPMELLPDREFRNAVYRMAEPVPKKLDKELSLLGHGELVCFRVGWVLEKVALTRLWLQFNDNELPRPEAYEAYRKRRAEYWKKRMAEIYKAFDITPMKPKTGSPQ